MRQRLPLVITVALVLVVLVALNAASYVQVESAVDSETNPDRSTYNSGPTGTRALYDFLSETGRPVVRWREPPAALSGAGAWPATFVVVGENPRAGFTDEEAEDLLRWVRRGGRLVVVARRPRGALLPSSGGWDVSTVVTKRPEPGVRSGDVAVMTKDVRPARPVQPSVLTRGVTQAMPSQFAARANFFSKAAPPAPTQGVPAAGGARGDEDEELEEDVYEEDDGPSPPPPPASTPAPYGGGRTAPPPPAQPDAAPQREAPVVHLADEGGALLVDYKYGAGRVVLLTDPYVVANGGIRLEDNLRLAVNVVTGGAGGLVAFDEYHQGRRAGRNEFLAYFAGTPVVAMLGQGALIVLAVLWTRGRRFARPLPVPQTDRRSTLEFVGSMAELQQRARAYDLAVENIYARTRRALVRYAGADNNSPRGEIAARVAARSKLDRAELEELMRECEDAINGAPVSAKKSLSLVARLREVERALGIGARLRDTVQAQRT